MVKARVKAGLRLAAVWHDMSSPLSLLLLLLLVLRAHLRSRGGHHRCIHYNAVSPHEDWMHPLSLDAASDDGLTTAVGWRFAVVGWDSWDGRTLEISRACKGERNRNSLPRAVIAEVAGAVRSHDRPPMRRGMQGGRGLPQFVYMNVKRSQIICRSKALSAYIRRRVNVEWDVCWGL